MKLRRWALIALAVLPFQLILLQHLSDGPEATGFLQYDSPYYVANGRAVFERGNGFAGPNPYDPSPAAPAIYFQWLTWLFGFAVKVLGMDPGVVFVVVGLLATFVGGELTLQLVETMLPEARWRRTLFLLTTWGGGLLCVAAMGANLVSGRPAAWDLFRFDPGHGWWFLNWGRNFVLPTEAVYHALSAATWLGVLRRRWGVALGAAGALALTHPFSGVEQLLILLAWCGVCAVRERTPASLGRAAIVAAMLALFGGYYFWFLNRFPSHRALVSGWSAVWDFSTVSLVFASGLVAVPAVARLVRLRGRSGEREGFLLVAFVVALLLMKHDWFIAARQPVHFARGYNWLPLWLIGLPEVRRWIDGAIAIPRRGWAAAAIGAGALLLVSDNALFLASDLRNGEAGRVLLTANQREMLAWIDHAQLRGVLLCADPRLSYLSATYTGLRPYYGHLENTPDVHERWRRVAAWQRQGVAGPWLETIDYILLYRGTPPVNFDRSHWRELHGNGGYVILGRSR